MLADGKHVSIRVFEPCNLVAGGRRPDAQLGVLNEGIFFEGNALLFQGSYSGFNILHLPAEDGAPDRSEVRNLADADHAFAGFHHQRKLIKTDEL